MIPIIQRLMTRLKSQPLSTISGFLLTTITLHALLFFFFERGHQEGLTLFDSLWVTITTITTVGYGDLSATTVPGRLVTIVFGYGVGLSLFAWLAGEFVAKLLNQVEQRRRGMSDLSKLKKHGLIINVPSDTKVRHLIDQLRLSEQYKNCAIIVVANDLEQLPFDIDNVYYIRGGVTDPETYARAAIQSADFAIVLAEKSNDPRSDALTAAAISTIEAGNPGIYTVAECVREQHTVLFQHVKCDRIIYTDDHLVNLLVQEIEDSATARAITKLVDNKYDRDLYTVTLGAPSLGKTFGELVAAIAGSEFSEMPIGLVRGENDIHINPPWSEKIAAGDRLLLINNKLSDWSHIEARLFGPTEPHR